jgi:uncharacterized membrane protein
MGKSGLETFIGLLLIGVLIITGIANYKKQKKDKNPSPGSNTFMFVLFLFVINMFFSAFLGKVIGSIFGLIFIGVISLSRFKPTDKKLKSK